jgi:ABC-type Zn uptake system ZnuABC Zn-binding protein ZnuA
MKRILGFLLLFTVCLSSCKPVASEKPALPKVLAIESFLADIAQNVSGDRLSIESLIPVNADPHAYQPSPQDAVKLSEAEVLIINGANLETFISPVLASTSGKQLIITASAGLIPLVDPTGQNPEGDPHFWLDPNYVIKYVENVRDGLSKADPGDASVFASNAKRYITDLTSLDAWIQAQVQQVPETRRLLVTNHETFGYFAKRYGFTVVGAIVPSVSSGAAPSAKALATLVDQIRTTGAPAIFLESGTNPQLAEQIASETGVKVVSDLYTHSLSEPGGPASTYIDMMKYDVNAIVKVLK